ncbi:alpha/beta fold hydrolase [Streptomyces sp. NPDC052396]|uniref:alpha/beta fold hydrolase n=1 Tax=Streptomyces sp. NPDC052396 TaxID=3365689 RepID=UPI0037D2EDDB
MTSRTALLEECIPLTLGGYAYSGRIVHQPNATMAPVALVGGAFQHQRGWGRLEQGLLREASVITVDLPGWGGADRLPARHGFDFLAEALEQLLSKVAPSTVNVMGASYGSGVAYQWAHHCPDRVERLALLGTMAHLTSHIRSRIAHLLRLAEGDDRTEFVENVLEVMMCSAPQVTVCRRPTAVRCLSRALHELSASDIVKYRDNTERLLRMSGLPHTPAIRMPVLVATGEHDPLTTPALSREAACRFSDVRFTTFKDADHLVHLERPAELVDLLTRFFAGAPLAGLEYCHPIEYPGRAARRPLPAPRASAES